MPCRQFLACTLGQGAEEPRSLQPLAWAARARGADCLCSPAPLLIDLWSGRLRAGTGNRELWNEWNCKEDCEVRRSHSGSERPLCARWGGWGSRGGTQQRVLNMGGVSLTWGTRKVVPHCPARGGVQGQVGCCPGQPGPLLDLVSGNPADSREVGTQWYLRTLLI